MNKFYVYRFLNNNEDIIYVGKTSQKIEARINGHRHLSKECYDEIKSIEFIELNTRTDMSIYEIYYINKFKPKYNVQSLYDDAPNMKLEDKIWHNYDEYLSLKQKIKNDNHIRKAEKIIPLTREQILKQHKCLETKILVQQKLYDYSYSERKAYELAIKVIDNIMNQHCYTKYIYIVEDDDKPYFKRATFWLRNYSQHLKADITYSYCVKDNNIKCYMGNYTNNSLLDLKNILLQDILRSSKNNTDNKIRELINSKEKLENLLAS